VRVLLPRADIGREAVGDELRRAGATITEVVAYRTVAADMLPDTDPDVYGLLLEGKIDVVTFTSPSAARSFVRIIGPDQAIDLLKNTVVAVIGPSTADAARQLGLTVTIQPSKYTIPALVDAIVGHYGSKST